MSISPNQPTLTKEQKILILTAEAIAEAIRELREVPSGHLYARLCGSVDFDTYTRVIALLVKVGKISNTGHLLKWIG